MLERYIRGVFLTLYRARTAKMLNRNMQELENTLSQNYYIFDSNWQNWFEVSKSCIWREVLNLLFQMPHTTEKEKLIDFFIDSATLDILHMDGNYLLYFLLFKKCTHTCIYFDTLHCKKLNTCSGVAYFAATAYNF